MWPAPNERFIFVQDCAYVVENTGTWLFHQDPDPLFNFFFLLICTKVCAFMILIHFMHVHYLCFTNKLKNIGFYIP